MTRLAAAWALIRLSDDLRLMQDLRRVGAPVATLSAIERLAFAVRDAEHRYAALTPPGAEHSRERGHRA